MSDVDPVGPFANASAAEMTKAFDDHVREAAKAARYGTAYKKPETDATRKSGSVAELNQEYNAWTSAEAPTLFEGGIV